MKLTQHDQPKRVLIIGASSDLGILITKKILEDGHTVVAHFHRADAVLRTLQSPKLFLKQANLSNDAEAKRLVEESVKDLGGLDCLINLIGPFQEIDILETTPQQWRETVELNLNVAFQIFYESKKTLIENEGQILNFCYAGVQNSRSWETATAYAAAKAGLAILTKTLATRLGPSKVRVNAVCPGYLDFGKFSPEAVKDIESEIPLRKLGNPADVVSVVDWILWRSPSHVTGAFIDVAGGWEHRP